MPMVRMHIDQPVSVRVGIERMGGDEMRSGNHVPKMAVHGIDEEGLAIGVPIVAPRVHRSVGDHFDDFPLRMIPPHPAADRNSIGGTCAGKPEFSGGGSPAAPIQPSIGSPMKTVGKIVVIVGWYRKTIQHHLRWTIRNA